MSRHLYLALAAALTATPALAASALFDVDGSKFTLVRAMNAHGTVTGFSGPPQRKSAYVRSLDGTMRGFMAEGATETEPHAINDREQVTGFAYIPGSGEHCFLRQPDNTLALIDPPQSATCNATAINAAGAVAGYFFHSDGRPQSFLRDADGSFHVFEVTGDRFRYTRPAGLNSSGTIVGAVDAPNKTTHGFLRDPYGNLTVFDAPEARLTLPAGIARDGTVAGTWWNKTHKRSAGFLRHPDGTFETFAGPQSDVSITVSGINDKHVVVGYYYDGQGPHGFVRKPDGSMRTLQLHRRVGGTLPSAINRSGAIAGDFRPGPDGDPDKNLGFVWRH